MALTLVWFVDVFDVIGLVAIVLLFVTGWLLTTPWKKRKRKAREGE